MKPAIGVEPITFGLQNRYSANWVKQAFYMIKITVWFEEKRNFYKKQRETPKNKEKRLRRKKEKTKGSTKW